jgi:2-succinyl-6-hydroxy-2,4-cyclohexadiene-1-carboxylate synthase
MSARLRRISRGPYALAYERDARDPSVLLLHGFTGSVRTLDAVSQGLRDAGLGTLAVDLLGHGRSDAPVDPLLYSLERACADLAAILDAERVPRAALLGYSMGGRVALGFACAFPERVRALVLVGASAGLEQEAERTARREADERLAEEILRFGVPAFVERWMANPLFASQTRLGERFLAESRAQRLASSAVGLAGSLRGLGTGVQPALHAKLARLALPVLLVHGAEDAKFREIAHDLAARLPNARVAAIPEAGHAAQIENPAAFLAVTTEFLLETHHDP